MVMPRSAALAVGHVLGRLLPYLALVLGWVIHESLIGLPLRRAVWVG